MTTREANLRVYVTLLAVAMILLGIVLLLQLDSKASYVVIGVVFGVAASVPTSLLIVAASRQSQAHEEADSYLRTHVIVEKPRETKAVVIFDPSTEIAHKGEE